MRETPNSFRCLHTHSIVKIPGLRDFFFEYTLRQALKFSTRDAGLKPILGIIFLIASRITLDVAGAIDLLLVSVSYIAQSEIARASRHTDGTNPSPSHPTSFSSLLH